MKEYVWRRLRLAPGSGGTWLVKLWQAVGRLFRDACRFRSMHGALLADGGESWSGVEGEGHVLGTSDGCVLV